MRRLLFDGFLDSWQRTPDAIALEAGGGCHSYRALGELAMSVAATLCHERGSADPGIVGLLGEHGAPTCAALLGISMSGSAYLPLGAAQPVERLADMINRAGCATLVVAQGRLHDLGELLALLEVRPRVLCPQLHGAMPASVSTAAMVVELELHSAAEWRPRTIAPDSPAYLMFTSGSTGRPKGVLVSHANVRHFLESVAARYGFSSQDRFSHWFELDFDLSVFDLFAAWDAGATVCVPAAEHALAPARFVGDARLSVWFSVPSIGRMMMRRRQLTADRFPSLVTTLFCGEALTQDLIEAWEQAAPASIVENLYGPTELTLACTAYRCGSDRTLEDAALGGVPIGSPLPGMTVLVADADRREVARGTHGELLMAGPQVASGYWNDGERTAAVFVVPPGQSARYYRTGDLVSRYGNTDALLFHGRIDQQVQVRGVRVEMGEVEAAIRECCGASTVVVLPWPLQSQAVESLLAVVEADAPTFDVRELQKALRQRLPDIMVPRQFKVWANLPLNVNGKVDRGKVLALLSAKT